MSLELLEALQDQHAFDPAPRRFDLGIYHVPFDDLQSNSDTENALARSVRVPERVALVGPSGSGKTSVISHVLGPMDEDIAPIRIPVAAEGAETVTSREGFARHIVRTVANYATEANLMSSEERAAAVGSSASTETIGGASRMARIRATLPDWLLKNTGLGLEIAAASTPTDIERSGSEIVDQASRVVDLVAQTGVMPVLVIDDSDSWLNLVEGDRTPLVQGFFGPVTRMMAEELAASVVVAVHETYLDMNEFKGSEGFIERLIHLPRLGDAQGLDQIIGRRVGLHTGADLIEVFEPAANERLFDHYEAVANGSLRRVMLVAHAALAHAVTDRSNQITVGHIETAIAEL